MFENIPYTLFPLSPRFDALTERLASLLSDQ